MPVMPAIKLHSVVNLGGYTVDAEVAKLNTEQNHKQLNGKYNACEQREYGPEQEQVV